MWSLSKYQNREIIDLAVEIEKKGSEFYKKLAAKAPGDQIKELLLHLAAEEEKHQARFVELGKDFAPVNAPETHQGEYFEYIDFIVETHMFNNSNLLEQFVKDADTGLDIIKLAIKFEKDSIMFFSGLRNLVLGNQQAVIDDLIMEEQIHLVKLSRLRKEVTD